jgi:hypothetical protein
MVTVSDLDAIKHLVSYAEKAYKNDDGTEFQMASADLTGEPSTCRMLQIITPVGKSTQPGLVSKITSNTCLHLGIRNGDTLVLAFRGTDLPMNLNDVPNPERWRGFWSNCYTDICYSLTALDFAHADRNPNQTNIPDLADVLVHEGFLLAFNSLLDDGRLLRCMSHLQESIKGTRLKNIEICGHSLGGALATLCALWCSLRFPYAKITCVTLGSPRVGNENFRAVFESRGIDCYRLVNASDPIPTIPDRYTELIPLRISPNNPKSHIRQRSYQHTGKAVWLHVGQEIVLEQDPYSMFTTRDSPEIQREEDGEEGGELASLRRWGVLSWRWAPYWTWRVWRILRNLPDHHPTRYVVAVGKILNASR